MKRIYTALWSPLVELIISKGAARQIRAERIISRLQYFEPTITFKNGNKAVKWKERNNQLTQDEASRIYFNCDLLE